MPKKQDAVELGLPHADELTALLRRAREGDRTALPALRKVLDAKPSVWRAVGDLGNLAEQAMLDLIAGEDLLVRESVKRTLAQMRQDLCGQKASPLEVLIARRAAVAWLHVSYLDVLLARAEKLDAVEARRLQNRRDRVKQPHRNNLSGSDVEIYRKHAHARDELPRLLWHATQRPDRRRYRVARWSP